VAALSTAEALSVLLIFLSSSFSSLPLFPLLLLLLSLSLSLSLYLSI
jgi:hypothetical protein